MKISAIVIAAGLLALVIFTTGCVQEQQSDVGMAVEFNDHAACAYVAKENGWYKEEGLSFTAYESYATGIRLASALARGDIQVAYICLSPAILAYSRGVPIKIVAGTHKYGYGLVVSPSITNVSDLTGKTIGCVREGAPADLLLNRMIEEYKLKYVKIRRMNPLKQVVALETGRIDAAILPEHHATVAESKGFHMLIKSQDLWPDMQGSVLVVKANPDPTTVILANVLDTEPEVINRSMSRLNYTTDIDAESVQEMIDCMVRQGYIEEGLRAKEVLDTRFLQGERDVY
jgi:NitT/TauT family transport system substrate-binding protein